VHLALSRGGYLGKVGDLRIDAQTGDIEVEPPQTWLNRRTTPRYCMNVPYYPQEQEESSMVVQPEE